MAHIERHLREMALFAGAGGGILGGKILGWECVCAVEWEPYPAAVLAARQNEGFLPPFPIWDDVQTFDGRPWRGIVDVVSGGFPCQDISAAGKGAGITGERSGMWRHMARIVGEVRPRYVLVENSPILTSRGLDVVLGDLAALGYDAEWGVLGAVHAGAPHNRERIWILAYSSGIGRQRLYQTGCNGEGCGPRLRTKPSRMGWIEQNGQHPIEDVADTNTKGLQGSSEGRKENNEQWKGAELWGATSERGGWWATEPNVGRVAHGVAARVDRLKAIGNGQVPQVVRLAWHTLHERIQKRLTKAA